MKLKPIHFSFLGVGISAIGVLIMIWYYRSQAANAAAQTDNSSALGSFPYFQSAALPSSADGTTPASSAASTGSSDLDLTPLIAASNLQTTTTASTALSDQFSNFLGSLASQQNQELSAAGQPSTFTTGYVNPTSGGGLIYGLLSSSVFSSASANQYLGTNPFTNTALGNTVAATGQASPINVQPGSGSSVANPVQPANNNVAPFLNTPAQAA